MLAVFYNVWLHNLVLDSQRSDTRDDWLVTPQVLVRGSAAAIRAAWAGAAGPPDGTEETMVVTSGVMM